MTGRMSSATRLLLMAVLFSGYRCSLSGRPQIPRCNSVKMQVLFPVSFLKKSCYPNLWSPDLKLSWPDDKSITIQFDHSMTNFTSFNVTLLKDDRKLDNRKINASTITYPLKCNGKYTFTIQPIDNNQWAVGDCLCYDNFSRCQWCLITKKYFIFRTGEDCPKPEPTSSVTSHAQNIMTVPVQVTFNEEKTSNNHPTEDSTNHPFSSEQNSKAPHIDSKITTIIFICAGIVIAVILGLVVVYFMFKNRTSSSSGILQNYDNLIPEDDTLTTKQVLLLFSNDHDFHYNVVNCLTSSLENDFKCHILYTPCITEKGILQWLHKTVAECDTVLLLHSESIKRQCEAWRVGKEYSQLRDDPNESTLMPILAHLQNCPKVQPYYSKFVSCHLKHLSDKYILHEFPSRDNFVLVKELKELVCRLHQLPPNSNLKKAFKMSLDSYHNTPKGQSLIQAIERTAKFEENQNWFIDKYKCAEYCTESTTDKCDCTSIFISDYQNGGIDYLKTEVDGRHDRLPKPYFNDINSVSDISHCSTMLADINERNDRSLKNRNSFLETLPDDVHDLSM